MRVENGRPTIEKRPLQYLVLMGNEISKVRMPGYWADSCFLPMPSKSEPSLPSPEAELELLINLIDEATSVQAEERLRAFYGPRVSRFLRKLWVTGLPTEITDLTGWVLRSFVEGSRRNVFNGDEPIATTMIRLAKSGLKEYHLALDGKLATPQQSPHEKTAVWLDWELLRLDGKNQALQAHVRDLCLSKSKLACFVLRAMCDGNGSLSDTQLIEQVRQMSGELNATAMEILLIREELRSGMRNKIRELRKPAI